MSTVCRRSDTQSTQIVSAVVSRRALGAPSGSGLRGGRQSVARGSSSGAQRGVSGCDRICRCEKSIGKPTDCSSVGTSRHEPQRFTVSVNVLGSSLEISERRFRTRGDCWRHRRRRARCIEALCPQTTGARRALKLVSFNETPNLTDRQPESARGQFSV